MTLMIDLSTELERQLSEEAARRGQEPATYALTVIQEKLAMAHSREGRLAEAIAAGRLAWNGRRLPPDPPFPPVALNSPEVSAAQFLLDSRR